MIILMGFKYQTLSCSFRNSSCPSLLFIPITNETRVMKLESADSWLVISDIAWEHWPDICELIIWSAEF